MLGTTHEMENRKNDEEKGRKKRGARGFQFSNTIFHAK